MRVYAPLQVISWLDQTLGVKPETERLNQILIWHFVIHILSISISISSLVHIKSGDVPDLTLECSTLWRKWVTTNLPPANQSLIAQNVHQVCSNTILSPHDGMS